MITITQLNGYVLVRSDENKLIKCKDEVHSEYIVKENDFVDGEYEEVE